MMPAFEIGSSNDEGAAPSEQVVLAVLERGDQSPTELSPLYETIDPEALDTLLRGNGSVRMTFEYEGYEVRVQNFDRVVLHEIEKEE